MNQQDSPKKPDSSPPSINGVWLLDVIFYLVGLFLASLLAYVAYNKSGLFMSIFFFFSMLATVRGIKVIGDSDRRRGF